MSLSVVPVTFRQAREFIICHHRHHGPPQGMKFVLGAARDGYLVGVATVGRPVARHLDDGHTVEVTRTCTDGTRNANSLLLGAAWRAARALGYQRLITYTEQAESGASLRGAGLRPAADLATHRGWHRPSRPRADHRRAGIRRTRWEITTRTASPASGDHADTLGGPKIGDRAGELPNGPIDAIVPTRAGIQRANRSPAGGTHDG